MTKDFPKERLEYAISCLRDYKRAKAPLESRIKEEELWWQLRHWEVLGPEEGEKPVSAWLFSNITNKHADAMDNFPEPAVLPREPGDRRTARQLSLIIPAVMERCGFEQTYSDAWWYKLKHGAAAYGVFWDSEAEKGLGDIDITFIDLLNIFWEPGISDIQQSRNLFIAARWDRDIFEKAYPGLKGKAGDIIDVMTYVKAANDDKVTVIDWYYKKDGRVHYCKFAGEHVLYSSEYDPKCQKGWYSHGKYPVVIDNLFPMEGQPVGFGYIAVTKNPQEYIDRLGKNILESSLIASRPRYFSSRAAGINEEEFLDFTRPLVHVEGSISDERIRPITPYPLGDAYIKVQQMKIEEMKETAANRDFSAGSTSSGVTAASAISALQEAGNKTSRDMIAASYRAYAAVAFMCLELIFQFYGPGRCFRIAGSDGFVIYSGFEEKGEHPSFDIKITAQKKNPFARVSQNELAKELYSMGFFKPELANQALGALELMDFEGKDTVRSYIVQNSQKEEKTGE